MLTYLWLLIALILLGAFGHFALRGAAIMLAGAVVLGAAWVVFVGAIWIWGELAAPLAARPASYQAFDPSQFPSVADGERMIAEDQKKREATKDDPFIAAGLIKHPDGSYTVPSGGLPPQPK